MSAQITSIGQIAITVQDLQRAIVFYRDILGLSFLFETGGMAFFNCGSTRLMLTTSEKPDTTYGSIIYYRTDDIAKMAASLRAQNVHFEDDPRMIAKMPDHDLWMAFFHDSEGNLLALMSEVR